MLNINVIILILMVICFFSSIDLAYNFIETEDILE